MGTSHVIIDEIISLIESLNPTNNGFKELYLIGNTEEINSNNFQDFDFAMIVNSQSNITDLIQLMSEGLVKIMKSYKTFISIFPILEFDFNEKNTMFIKNISANGVKVR